MSPTTLHLREVRQAKGLSQVKLGRRAKVRQATISALESGRVRNLDLDILDRLAAVLEVQPVVLLGWEPEQASERSPAKGPRGPRRSRRR